MDRDALFKKFIVHHVLSQKPYSDIGGHNSNEAVKAAHELLRKLEPTPPRPEGDDLVSKLKKLRRAFL